MFPRHLFLVVSGRTVHIKECTVFAAAKEGGTGPPLPRAPTAPSICGCGARHQVAALLGLLAWGGTIQK